MTPHFVATLTACGIDGYSVRSCGDYLGGMMEKLVRRAIATIHAHYDEPLCLDDLARTATMSKFHFLRTFRSFTGVTPVRFLSAVRLHEAKRLLFATELDVAEISVRVGYGSLGTFTRRFTECVGLPPTQYRRMARGERIPMAISAPMGSSGAHSGALSGTVHGLPHASSPVFLGIFESRIPQGQPVACATGEHGGRWRMPAVPSGSWYLLAVCAADHPPEASIMSSPEQPLLVGGTGPIRVSPGTDSRVDVRVRPLDWAHPPLLIALPHFETLKAAM